MSNRKSGRNTDGRNPDGTFATGNSGKPKGTRHRATMAVEHLMDGSAEAITQQAVDMALEVGLARRGACPTSRGGRVAV